jgi:Domain of unknown function (DUF4136)
MTSHRFALTRRAAGFATLAAIAALAAGCATKADVRTDQEPGSDLKAYQTFAFYESANPAYMSLLEKHLRHAARTQLERQQYRYDERNPDLRVNYALQVLDKQEVQSTSRGHLGYRAWAYSGVETVDYKQGTLAIDLVDAKRNALVWRAVAEGRLDHKAMEQPQATIDAVVGEMFTRFPGAAKP